MYICKHMRICMHISLGLGAPLRMMCMYANHPLNCVLFDYDAPNGVFDGHLWTDAKKVLKAKNPLMNIPYVVVDDQMICQSIACATRIGIYEYIRTYK
jgi:hypothetical protein